MITGRRSALMRTGVHVTDRDRERVGGVERDAVALPRQERQHHRAHLRLFGGSVSDERLLHEARLVLVHGDVAARGRGEEHAPPVRELDRRRDVLPREDGLDGARGRVEIFQEPEKLRRETVELRRQRTVRRPPDSAPLQMQTPVRENDRAITRRSSPWVEAEDDHGRSSRPENYASSTSKLAHTFCTSSWSSSASMSFIVCSAFRLSSATSVVGIIET